METEITFLGFVALERYGTKTMLPLLLRFRGIPIRSISSVVVYALVGERQTWVQQQWTFVGRSSYAYREQRNYFEIKTVMPSTRQQVWYWFGESEKTDPAVSKKHGC